MNKGGMHLKRYGTTELTNHIDLVFLVFSWWFTANCKIMTYKTYHSKSKLMIVCAERAHDVS